jgi:hypothetical protein
VTDPSAARQRAERDQATVWAATVYLPSHERHIARAALARFVAEFDALSDRVEAAETIESKIMRAALAEDTGALICLIYDLDEKRLHALIEAAQLIDKEACDCAEAVSPSSPNREATQ